VRATRSQQPHQTKLDMYSVKEQPVESADLTLIEVAFINVNLSTEPVQCMPCHKVEILVDVIRDFQNREGYALQTKVRDTLFMMGVVRDDDEFERLLRIAYSSRRIREHGVINGAWVVYD
jgi:hypothetical protein